VLRAWPPWLTGIAFRPRVDYPYEYVPEEVAAQDQLPIDVAARKAFFQGIAEQVFGL
jgi:hypothetical protein